MDKNKAFEELIWKAYSQEKNFDQLRHQLIRCRDIMSKSQKTFVKMPIQQQFDYCVTIGIIVVQSTTKDLRKISILKKNKNEPFPYSLMEGFVEPTPIKIKEKLQLKYNQ